MTFGTLTGQNQALADILVEKSQATGQNPLYGLP